MTRQVSVKLYLSIIATGLMAFCGVLIETAMNITFPTLMKQFGVNTATVQWLTTGYLLIVSVFVPISSFLKRRFTTKQLFLTANLFFIVGLIICSLTNQFALLLIGRLIQGIGTGIALPLMFNIILEQAPINKIGFLMGIGTLVTAIAPALGPTYGGLLVDINWHLIFGLLLIVMVIALIIGSFSITQVSKPQHIQLDLGSWFEVAIFFVGAILAFNTLAESVVVPIITGIIAIIGMGLFIARSTKISNPIINMSIFKNAAFDFHLLSYLTFQIMNVGVAFILPNYLQFVNHSTSLNAGLLLFPGAACGAVLAPLSGKLFDTLGAKKPIYIGLVLQGSGLILLTVQALSANVVTILVGYILMMLGTGFAMGNIMTNGLSQVAREQNTDGNAAFNTLQQFAGALGTAVVSLIISVAQTPKNYALSTALGAQHAFILLVILEVLNLIAISFGFHLAKKNKAS